MGVCAIPAEHSPLLLRRTLDTGQIFVIHCGCFLLLFLIFVVCCCISRTACVTVSLNATVFVTRCQNIVLPVHFTTHGYYILRLFRYHKKPRMMALMLMVRRRSRSLPSSLGPLVWSNQGARTTTLADDITWWLCSFSWRCCDHDFDGCGESL